MTDSTVIRYLHKAKQMCMESQSKRFRIGAVLVYGNNIIAKGCNIDKTNPLQYKYNKYRNFRKMDVLNNGVIHAEMNCLCKIRFLDIDYSKVKIFICRIKRDGTIALAKPCKACQMAMRDYGITEIYYTDNMSEKGWSKLEL